MEQLKFIWHDNGKHKSNSSRVSIRELTDYGIFDVVSPTDIVGTGSCYSEALEDFNKQLEDYISSLIKFKTEIANSTKAYTEVVEVDSCGIPLAYTKAHV